MMTGTQYRRSLSDGRATYLRPPPLSWPSGPLTSAAIDAEKCQLPVSSARSRSAATRMAAESRTRAQVQPPHDTRRLSFMLKLTGFFDRNPAFGVPALGRHCHAEAS